MSGPRRGARLRSDAFDRTLGVTWRVAQYLARGGGSRVAAHSGGMSLGVRLVSDRQPDKLVVDDHTKDAPAIWLHDDHSFRDIGLQQYARLRQQPRQALPRGDEILEMLALFRA